MVSPPQVAQIIRLRSWHGVVLDVFTNDAGKTILRVQTVRNVFRRLNPDLAPDAIEPANLDDLQREVTSYEAALQRSIGELVNLAGVPGDGGSSR